MSTLEIRLLTIREMLDELKISRASLYRFKRTPDFPKAIKLGGSNRWVASEVEEWLRQRPRR